MTLTLDIPPELETQLREAPARVGQAPEAYIIANLAVVMEESAIVPGHRRIGSEENMNSMRHWMSWKRSGLASRLCPMM